MMTCSKPCGGVPAYKTKLLSKPTNERNCTWLKQLGRGGGAQVSRANLLVARRDSARTSYARAARPGVKARANYLCVRASQYDLYFLAFVEPYQVRASLNPLDSTRQPHVGVLQARRKEFGISGERVTTQRPAKLTPFFPSGMIARAVVSPTPYYSRSVYDYELCQTRCVQF
jgi:hypothetical protein